jgi:agmatine deiminase
MENHFSFASVAVMLDALLMPNDQKKAPAAPAQLGFAMPAEWEPHAATWLTWPHFIRDWPGKFEPIHWAYGEMARKISAGETVRLLVRHGKDERLARHVFESAGVNLRKIEFVFHRTDRSWTRDTGPTFIQRKVKRAKETAIVHFHFNAWAKHDNWRNDTKVPDVAARLLRKPLFQAEAGGRPLVLEGGGIEVNGRGTLLTTEECYLHPTIQVRNPGFGKSDYEAGFKNYLGATNVFWLGKGPQGDDTHGHVDDICRFVNARTLVLMREKNPRDANYRALAENWDRIGDLRLEDGSKPEVVPLPMPEPLYFNGIRLPASYANFYICNAAVIVPTFNDPNDRVALGILAELFPDRPVIGIHAVDLVWGRGTLHCLTQQQPA